jgi:hypothetical protein
MLKGKIWNLDDAKERFKKNPWRIYQLKMLFNFSAWKSSQ